MHTFFVHELNQLIVPVPEPSPGNTLCMLNRMHQRCHFHHCYRHHHCIHCDHDERGSGVEGTGSGVEGTGLRGEGNGFEGTGFGCCC